MKALDHTAAQQLVPNPAATGAVVAVSSGGQPQLVQDAPDHTKQIQSKRASPGRDAAICPRGTLRISNGTNQF